MMIRKLLSIVMVFAGLIVGLAAGLIALMAFLWGGARARRTVAWREVAARYRGQLETRWWLPAIRFPWHGTPTLLRSVRRTDGGRGPGVLLETRVSGVKDRLWIASRQLQAEDTAGGQSWIATGNPAFDDLFQVALERERPAAAGPVLNDAIQWQLVELARWSGQHPVWLVKHGPLIRIGREGRLDSAMELEDFLRLSLRIIDQFRLVEEQGVRFVDEGRATLMDDACCPVCSGKMTGPIVLCVRCKTPHCRDCWDYNGKCGMFACGETRRMVTG